MKNKALLLFPLLLLPGLTACSYTYKDGDSYIEYEEKINFAVDSTINTLDIDWVSGKVEINEGDAFGIYEEMINGEYFPLYYRELDNVLTIKYCKNNKSYASMNMKTKKLVVTVPSHLEALYLDGTSGEYYVKTSAIDNVYFDITSGKLDAEITTTEKMRVDMTSGSAKIKTGTAQKVDISLTSGDVSIDAGSIDELKADSTSGGVSVLTGSLRKAEFDMTSGKINLTVTDSLKLESIDTSITSGNMTFNYDGVKGYHLKEKKSDVTVLGTDTSLTPFEFKFSATSGKLTINII